MDWSQLMTRVFEFDVTQCPKCGTKGMQVIACITKHEAIRALLTSVGQPTAPPQLEPPCRIDEDDLDHDTAA